MRIRNERRRGIIAVLSVVLLTVLLGMLAFAVDVGYITSTQAQLQDAADAAALAGAGQLMQPSVLFSLPGQSSANQSAILSAAETSASTYATNFASYNAAGPTTNIVLRANDIEYGLTAADGTYTKYTGNASYANSFPNTIKVTLRMDGTSGANPVLPLFFGQIFGVNTSTLTATASATTYSATLDTAHILPVTYDRNFWNTFITTGASPDGTVNKDGNNNPILKVFPTPNKASGGFGYLSLDNSSVSASSISSWLSTGLSAANLQTLEQNGLVPLSTHNNTLWDWKGATGIKTSDLNSIQAGEIFLLPLFNPVVATIGDTYQANNKNPGVATPGQAGNGTNAYYQIVQFVAVQVTSVNGAGGNSYLYVTPYAYIDPTATYTGVTPDQPGSLITTFTTPKLTQ